MGLVRCPPANGIPWRDTVLAGVGAALIPGVAGLIWVGALSLAGEDSPLLGAALLLMLTPILSGAGLIIVLPLAGILLRQGWFGWIVAAALGFGTGLVVEQVAQYPGAALFGAGVVIIMRALLGRLRAMD